MPSVQEQVLDFLLDVQSKMYFERAEERRRKSHEFFALFNILVDQKRELIKSQNLQSQIIGDRQNGELELLVRNIMDRVKKEQQFKSEMTAPESEE